MELLLFWGIPVIAALVGFQRMFYRAFVVFAGFGFAAYLGVWSEGFSAAFFRFLPPPLQPAVAVVAAGVIVGGVLFIAFHALNPEKKFYVFPAAIDRGGGALLGFLAARILIAFLGLAACLSPYKAELPLGLEIASVQSRSAGSIMALTRGINLFTLQSGRNTACREKLDGLLAAADEAAASRAPRPAATAPEGAAVAPREQERVNKPGTLRHAKEQKEEREREVNQ